MEKLLVVALGTTGQRYAAAHVLCRQTSRSKMHFVADSSGVVVAQNKSVQLDTQC